MATLTVQPSAKDTYLSLYYPTSNYGTGLLLYVNDRAGRTNRSPLEFGITELPEGVTLTSATLQLRYYRWYYNSPVGKTVWAYKLSRTNWVEAEATWNIYKTGSNWTSSGGDYVTSSPAGGSTVVPYPYGWMSWDVLAIAQDAYANTTPVELLVKFEAEDLASGFSRITFRSSDYTTNTSYRPKLIIEYTPVATFGGHLKTSLLPSHKYEGAMKAKRLYVPTFTVEHKYETEMEASHKYTAKMEAK